jgi:O-antigen/teichoic acid export membrane protein
VESTATASRWLGDAAIFGDFSKALRLSHFLVHLFVMGQEAIILMFLAKYHPSKPNHVSGLIRWIAKSTLLKSIALFALIKIGLAFYLQWPFYYISKYVYISLIAMPFVVISGIYERFFLFLQKFFISFLPRGIYHPLLFMLILYLLPDSVEKRPDNALYVYTFAFMIISCISAIHGYFSGIAINDTPDYSDQHIWTQSGWLYTLSTLIIKGTPSMAIFLLERYGSNEKSVGFFAAIAALNYGYHLLTKPFDSYLKPSIAKLYHQNDLATLQMKINQVNKVRWIILSILTLTLILFGPKLLARYGTEYPQYYPALAVAAILSFLQYLGQPAHEILNYTGNQAVLSRIMTLQLVSIGILGKTLIPMIGLYGAVIAQGLPCLVCVIYSAYQLRQQTKLKIYFVI